MNDLKIVYFGTPDFAVPPLERLLGIAEVAAVVTNPDKPVGRKQILTPSPVKTCALRNGLKVLEYSRVSKEGAADLAATGADLFVTCAFGQILSGEILALPRLCTLNIHASLLPAYRGAAPIARAIMNGETQTGVTIMKTDAGVDTGDVMFSEKIAVGEDENAGSLSARLSLLGADCIEKALGLIASGNARFSPQGDGATYAAKIVREDCLIDFSLPARAVKNLVRALDPAPSAYTVCGGETLKIHSVEEGGGSGAPGTVIGVGKKFEIACGENSVIVKELTRQGGKRMSGADYLRGRKISVGDALGR